MIIEHDVEQHLVSRCKKLDYLCFKFTSPAINGVPDRIIIGNGYTVFCELKAPNKTLRKLQEVICKKMTNRGAIVYRNIDTKIKVDNMLADIERGEACSN